MAQAVSPRPSPGTKPNRMTYDEFLRRYMNGEHLEWVKGEVVAMSPVTREHEDERKFLIKIIDEYVGLKEIGAVSCEPYNMKIGHGLPGRSPDILFVATANLARMHNEYLDGPADLVIEIISPGSGRIDRVTKFAEYEQGGVREYWILDPKRSECIFYVRDSQGKYQPVLPGEDGIYRSTVLTGFWLEIAWLWQRPLPMLTEVLRAWGMI